MSSSSKHGNLILLPTSREMFVAILISSIKHNIISDVLILFFTNHVIGDTVAVVFMGWVMLGNSYLGLMKLSRVEK